MALITCYDADGIAHQKEPVDAREACLRNGFTMAPPGGGDGAVIAEYVPTKQELLAARDELQAQKSVLLELEQGLRQRESDLGDRDLQLTDRAIALEGREQELVEREAANQVEVQRLAEVAAEHATKSGSADVSNMTKAQLQAALDEKGVKFPASADKADLQALLVAAPTA